MFILDKKHQRKIVLFYNQNKDLLAKLSYTSSFLEINKKNKRAYLFQNKKINKIPK